MELNLNRVLTNLDGSSVEDQASGEPITLAKLLANNLWTSTKGDPVKYSDWARTLYRDGKIEVDRSDFETLKNFVKGMPASMFIIDQMLSCFILVPAKSQANGKVKNESSN